MMAKDNLESARRQLKRLVGRLTEAEAEEALRVLLDLQGPPCPYCGTRVPGLRLVWTAQSAMPSAPCCCPRCRQWFSPNRGA
jgi:hypothetical protein